MSNLIEQIRQNIKESATHRLEYCDNPQDIINMTTKIVLDVLSNAEKNGTIDVQDLVNETLKNLDDAKNPCATSFPLNG